MRRVARGSGLSGWKKRSRSLAAAMFSTALLRRPIAVISTWSRRSVLGGLTFFAATAAARARHARVLTFDSDFKGVEDADVLA